MKSVAVIGLGLMGGGLARQLVSSKYQVHGFDPDGIAQSEAAAAGIQIYGSPGAAVSQADVVITSLPTPEIVLESYSHSDNGILGHRSDQCFIDVSTVDPATSVEIERRVKDAGALFVASPLGKGPVQAATGESPLFLGGDREAVENVSDVLDAIGGTRHYFGDVGAASTFKLVSNMMGFANLAALCEGVLLAQRAGIDPHQFLDAITETGGMSYQVSLRLPWIIDSDFTPRFAVDLARKDLRLGVDLAARWAIPVPTTSAALQALVLASAAGYGSADAAAMVAALGSGENVKRPIAKEVE